jgi:hypothetical protein
MEGSFERFERCRRLRRYGGHEVIGRRRRIIGIKGRGRVEVWQTTWT